MKKSFCPIKQSYITLALFGVDVESMGVTKDTGYSEMWYRQMQTDSKTDKQMECDVIILALDSTIFTTGNSLYPVQEA